MPRKFYNFLMSISLLAHGSLGALAGKTDPPRFQALVFSYTPYNYHPNQEGITAIQALGAANNFAVTSSIDITVFDDYASLSQYQVLIFNNACMNNVFTDPEWANFQQYIRSGGGFVGIHCASDSEYNNAWYGGLVGARFLNHPAIQQATLVVEDATHPSTAPLPQPWVRTDEWYNFQADPRGHVRVLLTIDESSYDPGPGAMGKDHPMAWCQNYDGGRSWYTALGHTAASFQEPLFLQHLLGGIEWAAGAVAGNCQLPEKTHKTYLGLLQR